MIELSAKLEGSKELSRKFMKIPENISDFKVPLFRSNREVRISVEANYGSRGSLFGERWAPRKDSKPHPILEKTGRMRRSFIPTFGVDFTEIENISPVFPFHQSAAPRKKLPRRLMLKIDEIRRRFIVKEFQRHIQKQIKDTK